MSTLSVARKVASRYDSRFLRGYTLGKILGDPAYAAAAGVLCPLDHDLVDIGCGVGSMAIYLRALGFRSRIRGVDHDRWKIEAAKRATAADPQSTFEQGDARAVQPAGESVVMLDLLHYFTEVEQETLLTTVAKSIPAGGVAIIRDGLADGSWRYRATVAQESFSRAVRWLDAERLRFPTLDSIVRPFEDAGFEVSWMPMWGFTPFNNYFFVFRRLAEGTVKR